MWLELHRILDGHGYKFHACDSFLDLSQTAIENSKTSADINVWVINLLYLQK